MSQQITVNIADLRASRSAEETLITYALGSCLGIALHDPVAGVGGLLHAMLPEAALDPGKARAFPGTFVDVGMEMLLQECARLGAAKNRLVVKVAGGAAVSNGGKEDYFQIGRRNLQSFREVLISHGLTIHRGLTGGNCSRTMTLCIGTGEVMIKTSDGQQFRI